MASELTKMSCEDFASVLAARQPVPGGGGAAAYVGALGVALGSMVGTYTSGKKSAAAYEGDIRRMCGISSGTNVVAALRMAAEFGEGRTIVTILPDTAERYISTKLFCGE